MYASNIFRRNASVPTQSICKLIIIVSEDKWMVVKAQKHMKSISGERKYVTTKSSVIGSYMFDIEERIIDDIE